MSSAITHNPPFFLSRLLIPKGLTISKNLNSKNEAKARRQS